MHCSSCQAEVPATARFCPSCAEPVVKEGDVKSPAEVTVEWLKGILESQGYKVEIGNKDANTMWAKHDARENIALCLRRDVSLITIQSLWSMKKLGWGQKTDFLAAVNKANTLNWVCSCYAPDSLDSLITSACIYLTECISSRDVMAFLEMYSKGVFAVFSGLKNFV